MSAGEAGDAAAPATWSALAIPFVATVTLGLAPFAPEPHLVGKLRWVLGGAVGMKPMDWFDLAMHGAPVVWLVVAAVSLLSRRLSQRAAPTSIERS